MLDILRFTFQDFWHWAGMMGILAMLVGMVGAVFANINIKG